VGTIATIGGTATVSPAMIDTPNIGGKIGLPASKFADFPNNNSFSLAFFPGVR
jgi:hypothetical protein